MGAQKTNLMAHCEQLTAMLQASWETLSAFVEERVMVDAIRPLGGDVIVFRAPDKCPENMMQTLSNIGKEISRKLSRGGKEVIILVCPAEISVEALDPELLEAHGWRRPQLSQEKEAPTT